MPTNIEWADESWNPVTGCSKVSAGCANCYAERTAKRLAGRFGYPADDPFRVTLHPDRLDQPLHWAKPRRVFVCSMGDLFHEDVPDSFITKIFLAMGMAPQHTFQILTKRADRMLSMCERKPWFGKEAKSATGGEAFCCSYGILPNVWLGISVEDQETADERIPRLLECPAAVRFLSIEPMLGPVELMTIPVDGWPQIDALHGTIGSDCQADSRPKLDWVIVGGESGPGARPMHPSWARSIRDQCQQAGVPFFMKQWGAWMPRSQGWGAPCFSGRRVHTWPDGGVSYRVGKKTAGRLLDGREHNRWPDPSCLSARHGRARL